MTHFKARRSGEMADAMLAVDIRRPLRGAASRRKKAAQRGVQGVTKAALEPIPTPPANETYARYHARPARVLSE
jgi:hypothetical protein